MSKAIFLAVGVEPGEGLHISSLGWDQHKSACFIEYEFWLHVLVCY